MATENRDGLRDQFPLPAWVGWMIGAGLFIVAAGLALDATGYKETAGLFGALGLFVAGFGVAIYAVIEALKAVGRWQRR